MNKFSFLGGVDAGEIESLYQQFMSDPDSVESSWRDFFEGFEFARTSFGETKGAIPEQLRKEFRVLNLMNGYRSRGHLFTDTNPVRERRKYTPTLAIENFGLSERDLEEVFQAGIEIGIGPSKLKDIIAHLEETYCNSVGAEYKYIRSPEIIEWLEKKMEGSRNSRAFSIDEKKFSD